MRQHGREWGIKVGERVDSDHLPLEITIESGGAQNVSNRRMKW
jgi:hypothetical protein